ncbi:hypothetical protein FBU30_004019 [Linnemannia zychae]|nr:hypothetical protein FBU30_004019 [Linnemannia zychae]
MAQRLIGYFLETLQIRIEDNMTRIKRYMYSSNFPNQNTKTGRAVNNFVRILVDLELHEASRNQGELNARVPFPPKALLHPTASQLPRVLLKHKLMELVLLDQDDPTTITSVADLGAWIGSIEPGYIIKKFVCDIDLSGLSSRQKRRSGHHAAISLRSLSEIQDHVQFVSRLSLKIITKRATYPMDPYGHARFKRLPDNDLSLRLTITVAGSDYYHSEICNVIRNKDYINKLWTQKSADNMKMVALDGGQVGVVVGFAYLPKDSNRSSGGEGEVRSLGYLDILQLKKCPRCFEFVAQVTLRNLYCCPSKRYYHCDTMTAQNMCDIVQQQLKSFQRLKHLQPIVADGSSPWITSSSSATQGSETEK